MRRRLLRQEGFGLVELLIALTVLTIGIFAIVAGFSAGAASLGRAARVSTGSAVADKQLELYRGLAWTSIGLCIDPTCTTDATYKGEVGAYNASPPPGSCTSVTPDQCNPSRVTAGPDGKSYRVDTYMELDNNGNLSRNVKRVTVVVRDDGDPTLRPYARQISTFDELG